ncbi:MAPEG family protein [Achromobacter sp. Marseille-Q4962]|uniref:MAPEG family protein n=1 Tax=Achromobacter sp. Marseille-Q4962 TaxID=2942202 RepID=UPI00207425B3|nr:MAPEG family protein [Achromobacter sp. Marseille-Q4962]
MKTIAWLMLAAAALPWVAAILAKAGGKGFDNNDPRPWLARQEGWRARADAAQANTFEALPFFFGAVLFALYTQAPAAHVATLMACWLGVRLGYLALYLAGWGGLRSLAWAASVGFVIAILFAGA